MKINRRDELMKLSKERLVDFIDMANKNYWTLQNNYIGNLSRRFGSDVATEFDQLCFGRSCEVQAYRLKKFFNLGNDLKSLVKFYIFSQAASYADYEFPEISDRRFVRQVPSCPMQLDRKKAGLPVLPCKAALSASCNRVAKVFNPQIKVSITVCPPDPHPENLWCEVLFELEN